jgi:hypothetical protein
LFEKHLRVPPLSPLSLLTTSCEDAIFFLSSTVLFVLSNNLYFKADMFSTVADIDLGQIVLSKAKGNTCPWTRKCARAGVFVSPPASIFS